MTTSELNDPMSPTEFEDAVSAITDRLWSESGRHALAGLHFPYSPDWCPWAEVRFSDTRPSLRSRVWTTARSKDFAAIRAAL